ncbi:hypothetical protein N7454_009457 [Penicillium verhagenii]|nr:hypothetical protein N7454_009457 [Penicillium verhagenii]
MEPTSYHATNDGLQIGTNYGPILADFRLTKRPKTSHHDGLAAPLYLQYSIAWIGALHIEMAAAQAMLDNLQKISRSLAYLWG